MSVIEQKPFLDTPEALNQAHDAHGNISALELEWKAVEIPSDELDKLQLVWQQPLEPEVVETIDQAQADRDKATRLTELRCECAPFIGAAIVATAEAKIGRVIAGAALALTWYTDRRDGKLARRSLSRLDRLQQEHPAVVEHPQVKHLLSDETKAEGARMDQEADKETSNTIMRSLIARATVEDDPLSATFLSGTSALTVKRDLLMARLRAEGHKQNVQVGAKKWGKIKTTMLAVGQGLMTISKKGSKPHRAGLGLIVGSNIPSWIAVYQMNRHIRRESKS